MNKNFNAGKSTNLAAGIINILTGTTAIVYSLFLLFATVILGSLLGAAGDAGGAGAEAATDAAAGALGLIMLIPLVIYIGIGITLICFGASNCKSFKLNESQTVERKGKLLGFIITEAILLVGMILVMIFLLPGIVSISLVVAMGITFILRLVAYILLRKVQPVKEADIEKQIQE